MANISITPVGAIFLMPSSIISLMPVPKPPSNANTIGTVFSATSGDSRLLMIRYMKVITIPKPSAVSMRANPLRRAAGDKWSAPPRRARSSEGGARQRWWRLT